MPHYIVILHALHNLSFSFTINFTFYNHKTIVEIHYNVDNSVLTSSRIINNIYIHYEIIYQLDAIEYLFVFFQLDIFRAYTPIFRSNGCYSFFTYAAYGVLGVVRCRS